MQLNRGFTLVEMMIAMVLGLIVLGATLAFFTSNLRANNTTLQLARLNQELQTLSTMMVRDIRRAGFRGDAVANRDLSDRSFMFLPLTASSSGGATTWTAQDLDILATVDTTGTAGSHANGGPYTCIILKSDLDGDGVLDTAASDDERVGYRYDSTNQQVDKGNWAASVTTPTCANGAWTAITSSNVVITALEFELDPPVTAEDKRLVQSVILRLSGHLDSNSAIDMTIEQRVRLRNNAF
ncbi:PilW family protein [Ferrimonas balearica]|uniref:PilW family protein n=1 Tax=Ferrimonas balearica TaxID=44012 RepID=UPI001C9924B0|nr:prepilin-type N-terminal cleavage/methylation domain-containing protein [Ferrimonas balearica]MBY5993429.1 prepilin-type N-terminal cleavage/methylation domain-containing protein [Ferrimonas balearica]